jgi:alkylation response protein AidB-like acyl-CoA dehydrogenase
MAVATTSPARVNCESSGDAAIQLCRVLGQGFARRAAEYDRQGRFPDEDFGQLREAGLYSLLVPAEYGGIGVDYLTYTKALEQLGAGCAATALAFNMHNIVLGSLSDLNIEGLEGRRGESIRRFCQWAYSEAVAGKLFATAASEPDVGPRLSQIKTVYRPVDGGFVINGVKSFVSMVGQADYCIVAARSQRDFGDLPGISYLVVERDNPGVRIEQSWDTLGMRATCSNTMHLTDCFVPRERLYLLEAVALYKATREPHWLVGSYNGVYLGLAAAIFQFVAGYITGRKMVGSETPLARDVLVQHRVGELLTRLEATRAVVYDAARLVCEKRGSVEAATAIHRAKYMVSDLGPWLAAQAIRLCGGAAIFRHLPLERYYRDACCAGLMPAKTDQCLTYVGKAALGFDVLSAKDSYW